MLPYLLESGGIDELGDFGGAVPVGESVAKKEISAAWVSKKGYLLVYLLIAFLIVGAGCSYFFYHKRIIRAEKNQELAAIADLKAEQIAQWRRDLLVDADSIFSNPMIAHRLGDYLQGRDNSAASSEINAWLGRLRESFGFVKAALIKPDGEAIFTDPAAPVSQDTLREMRQAIRAQRVILSDFHRDTPASYIHIDLIIPILKANAQHDGLACIAVLALEIDPQKFLYPLIQSWPAPSETAETILVERQGDEVLFLNELRHRKGTALSLRRTLTDLNMPAVRAALGQEGVFDGIDYRGVAVLAATRTIKGAPWAILAKIDAREVFAPISRRAWFVATLCFLTAFAAGLLVYLWWMRNKEAHLQQQYESELQHNSELKKAELALHLAHFELEKRVSERTTELTRTNARLREEMTERKTLQLKLIEAKQLESVGQLAGGVAHEVRNPLNAILTISEALFREKEIEENPEYRPYIEHIRAQVNRLAHLMNDLLELGKPIPDANLQPVCLHKLCQETISLWKSTGLSANRQVEMTSQIDPGQSMVLADEVKLQQVVFNLLENAGHHNPVDRVIQVQVGETPDGPSNNLCMVRITDQGPGIPQDKLARVFEPFYSNRKGGTGLGLTLVKHFTEHMGGTVVIRNNACPPGCTAEIYMPQIKDAQ